MSYDEKLKSINSQLEGIEEQLQRLKRIKEKLLFEKEKYLEKKDYENSEKLSRNHWEVEKYAWSGKVREKLRDVFKLETFRPMQLQTINATLSKHDVLFIAPTGGGKSMTYQLPAIVESGLTLVVSPLISLMEDQLRSLKERKIPAKLLNSTSTKEETKLIHAILEDPNRTSAEQMKLLYVTPERMGKTKRFMQALQKAYHNGKLDRIAIDEVHSVSTMGHDFRSDYKFLGNMKMLFPNVPILGVTATATRRVIIDIQKMLNIRGCIIFNSPFNRPNLYYHVIEKPSESEAVIDLLVNLLTKRYKGQCGIIYTFSTKDADTIADKLRLKDIKARSYHAQLEPSEKTAAYNQWISNKIQVVVATIAFGLGIDKPDVRFVIHHTISKSMENFYQESGRCGRDGKYAESILLYRMADMFKISCMTFEEIDGRKNAYSMIEYAINSRICRRDQFAKHFTEVWDDKNCGKMCDGCFYKNTNRVVKSPTIEIMDHYRSILRILEKAKANEIKLTALKLIDAWFHKGIKSLRIDDMPVPNIDRFYGEQILAFLIINEYLREDFHYTAYTTNSYIVQGPRIPTDNQIDYYPSRVYDLPPISELKDYYSDMTRPPSSSSHRNESTSSGHKSENYGNRNSTPTSSYRNKHHNNSSHRGDHYNNRNNRYDNNSTPSSSNYNRFNDRHRDSPNYNRTPRYNSANRHNVRSSAKNYQDRFNKNYRHESDKKYETEGYKNHKSEISNHNNSHHETPSSSSSSCSRKRKRKFSDDYEHSLGKRSPSNNSSNVSSTNNDDDEVIIIEYEKDNIINID